MNLSGKIIWITGASSGIGEALAYALAEKGAKLILSARSEDRLQAVRDACVNSGDHLIQRLDLGDADALDVVAKEVLERIGPIDILINNGGISQRALAMDTQLAVDRRIMEINYFGAVVLSKAVLPSMLARRSGQIVVISSLVGKFGTPKRTAYAASKHALHGFFDALRAEVFSQNVRVTIICPGFIRTNISFNALTGDGTPQDTMDRAQADGLPAAICARRMVRAIEREKTEVLIGGKERIMVYIKRFLPGLYNVLIRNVGVT